MTLIFMPNNQNNNLAKIFFLDQKFEFWFGTFLFDLKSKSPIYGQIYTQFGFGAENYQRENLWHFNCFFFFWVCCIHFAQGKFFSYCDLSINTMPIMEALNFDSPWLFDLDELLKPSTILEWENLIRTWSNYPNFDVI